MKTYSKEENIAFTKALGVMLKYEIECRLNGFYSKEVGVHANQLDTLLGDLCEAHKREVTKLWERTHDGMLDDKISINGFPGKENRNGFTKIGKDLWTKPGTVCVTNDIDIYSSRGDTNLPSYYTNDSGKEVVSFRNERGRNRLDGPAYIYDGFEQFSIDGKIINRIDFEDTVNNLMKNKSKSFTKVSSLGTYHYKDENCTIRHREDGPAITYADGRKEWYLQNQKYSETEFNKEIQKMKSKSKSFSKKDSTGTLRYYKDKTYTILHREDGPAIEWYTGDKEWFVDGGRHRVDGPAIEFANGDKHWWLYGKLNRENGPAIEYANGDKDWYSNGKLHRTDGPALEYVNGSKFWWLNDKKYVNEYEFQNAVAELNEKRNNNPTTIKNSEIKMTTEKHSVTSMLKTSMIEGAKRNGVRTLTKASLVGVQTAIVKSAPAGPNTDAIIAFMATPAAEILIKGIVGFAIPHIPQLQDHKLAQLLGGECRNQTAEDAQREVFDKVMEFIVPAVMGSLAELQNSPQMRILLDESNKEEVSVPSQDEEVVSKKSSAAL